MADINPTATATQMATYYTQGMQSQITRQTRAATATSAALNSLQSALKTFDTALAALSTKKGGSEYLAAVSGSSATATASASASAGVYSYFVEQTASAHQLAFEDLPALPVALGGPLVVQLADGSSFSVNLAGADANGDGTISQAEIARAINLGAGNDGRVAASVITSGGASQLILTGQSGENGKITLDVSGLPASPLKTALSTGTELAAARDAVVWLGERNTGLRLQQASNTFSAIPGVSLVAIKATAGTASEQVTITNDASGTAKNVRGFVDAYNALKTQLDALTKIGNAASNAASGAFATDASVRALRTRLSSMIRQDFDGVSLRDVGISADRYGVLSLNETKLAAAITSDASSLDKFFGSSASGASRGLLGAADTYLDNWLDGTDGHIARRQASVNVTQAAITARQERVDVQYDYAYIRYLNQYTKLQTLMSKMSQTSQLFTAALS